MESLGIVLNSEQLPLYERLVEVDTRLFNESNLVFNMFPSSEYEIFRDIVQNSSTYKSNGILNLVKS